MAKGLPRRAHPAPRIMQSHAAREALARGMERMGQLVQPTLGPLPRTVAVAPLLGSRPPEVLDSAATIARRTIQLADPFEDMGGMILRHLMWRVFERTGDGTATAGVLACALVRQAARYVAGGAQPVALRRGIELGARAAVDALRAQARPVELPAEIA